MECRNILVHCLIAVVLFIVLLLMWDINNQGPLVNLENRTSIANESDATLSSTLNRTRRWISQNTVDVPCVKRSHRHLEKMLGMAFNPQFTSIHKPANFNQNELREDDMNFMEISVVDEIGNYENGLSNTIAKISENKRFFESRFKREVTEVPDNVTVNDDSQAKNSSREARNIVPWACPSYNQWVDMGEDTFPRYMRSVTCSSKSCWFDRMSCQPRSFVVAVLRRKKSRCRVNAEEVEKIFPLQRKKGDNKLPEELREEWEMEERAANFCCECVFPSEE